MAAEVEVTGSLWFWITKFAAPAWKFILMVFGGAWAIFLCWARRVDSRLDKHDEAMAAYKLHVSEHYSSNEDTKEIKEDVKAIRETVTELALIIGGKK